MIYAVNIEAGADLPAVLAALSALGNVSQPFPRTPRYVHLDGPAGLGPQIDAIVGVCGCCDAEKPVTLGLITPTAPGRWNIGAISGTPHSEYGRDTGEFYLLDMACDPALVPDVVVIHNPFGYGDHGCGTGDQARQVWGATIYSAGGFRPTGTTTVADVNAAFDAINNHREDFGGALDAVCSCSFTSTGGTNPHQAAMDRGRTLGIKYVASTGNDGADLTITARWPVNDADYKVSAIDATYARPSWAARPADIYAGGSNVDFLLANGTYATGQGGTSVSCPLVAMSLRRAIDEGRDGAWLMSQALPLASSVPQGESNLVLHYPTAEVSPPPPDPTPPNLGDSIMQFAHVGIVGTAGQVVPNAQNEPVKWVTATGPNVEQIEHTIPAGWGVARAHVLALTKSLPAGKFMWLYVVNASGAPVAGGRAFFEGQGGNEVYMPVHTLAFPVQEGETYKVQAWHNGGAGVKVNERGDAQLGFELEKIS